MYFLSGPVLDYFCRRHMFELFGSGPFSGPVLNYLFQGKLFGSGFFFWTSARLCFFLGMLFWQWSFPAPVVGYFSRNHISELFGNGVLLDQW